MSEYQSSESLRRASRDAFVDKTAEKKAAENQTERQRVVTVLDKYIGQHSKTSIVRTMAKEFERSADYQLDLSADIVEILEKIKQELR